MKRYPDGADGEPFFMKRAPSPRPAWIETCAITHGSGNVIDFPMVQDLASLLWVVNLGCIDLNPWYARCDDVDRPDYLHFDLDPVPEATYEGVVETARSCAPRCEASACRRSSRPPARAACTSTSRSCAGRRRRRSGRFAKRFAFDLAALRPDLITAEYRIAKRPAGRVLVDYNQNAWGRTLASAYSPRPRPLATVSAPITWDELEAGARIDDFDLRNMPARIAAVGDLWAPLLAPRGRFDLAPLLAPADSLSALQPARRPRRAEQLVEPRQQQLELDRLDEVLVEAGVERALAVGAAAVAGQRDQARSPRVRGSARSAARELVAVHPRQADVEQRRRRARTRRAARSASAPSAAVRDLVAVEVEARAPATARRRRCRRRPACASARAAVARSAPRRRRRGAGSRFGERQA